MATYTVVKTFVNQDLIDGRTKYVAGEVVELDSKKSAVATLSGKGFIVSGDSSKEIKAKKQPYDPDKLAKRSKEIEKVQATSKK